MSDDRQVDQVRAFQGRRSRVLHADTSMDSLTRAQSIRSTFLPCLQWENPGFVSDKVRTIGCYISCHGVEVANISATYITNDVSQTFIVGILTLVV